MGLRSYFADSRKFKRNINAAQTDFLAILKNQQVPDLQAEVNEFLNSFQRSYNTRKRTLNSLENSAKPTGNKYHFSVKVIDTLEAALDYVKHAAIVTPGYQPIDDAKDIGSCFGILMACMEYGIVSGYFDPEESYDSVVKNIGSIVDSIHRLDKSVKLVNIAIRALEITDEHRGVGYFNVGYVRLLSEINAAFSSSYVT